MGISGNPPTIRELFDDRPRHGSMGGQLSLFGEGGDIKKLLCLSMILLLVVIDGPIGIGGG